MSETDTTKPEPKPSTKRITLRGKRALSTYGQPPKRFFSYRPDKVYTLPIAFADKLLGQVDGEGNPLNYFKIAAEPEVDPNAEGKSRAERLLDRLSADPDALARFEALFDAAEVEAVPDAEVKALREERDAAKSRADDLEAKLAALQKPKKKGKKGKKKADAKPADNTDNDASGAPTLADV